MIPDNGNFSKPQKYRHKISDLAIPQSARDFLASKGFEELYPPQAAAVSAGLLDGTSLLVSAPTASGKTLVAMLAIISHIARGGRRAVYLSPLRALAAEKHAEFAELAKIATDGAGWERMRATPDNDAGARPIRAVRATGDARGNRSSSSAYGGRISDADVIVATNEAVDAAIRRNLEWTGEVDLVIADEVHLIGDETRGPTLEMVLTQLKRKNGLHASGSTGTIQVVGLSATIQNDIELARWLGCMLVQSDWRPVPLAEGVCDDGGCVTMNDGRKFQVKAGPEGIAARLAVDAVAEGGQSLIFAATRPSSRATATRTSKIVESTLSEQDRDALAKVAARILPGAKSKKTGGAGRDKNGNTSGDPAQSPTDLQKDVAALVAKGVAFHHAGLSDKMRDIIETEFRKGTIKIIASTPTLAAGVNLPARRVVISTVSRYDPKYGYNKPISVLEYKQLCGRAGRPQYDDYGESIACTPGTGTFDLFDGYINGELEPIESQIMGPKALHTHLLTVIVLNPGIKRDTILEFFMQTLAGVQYYEDEITNSIDAELGFLLGIDMIASRGGRYAATSLGKRTSSLYVDPSTAAYLHNVAKDVPEGGGPAARHTLGFLHAVTSCDEFLPKQNLLKNHYQFADELLSGPHSSELLTIVCAEDCTRGMLVLNAWMAERTDKEIETAFKSQSGDLHRMTESASWLVYVLQEMAKHAGRRDLLGELATLRARLKFGIKEELVDLAGARGIGRVRARALYNAGIRNMADLNAASLARLSTIRQIGPTVAASIKREASVRAPRV